METCDVLIVGGGPAGSSCAWKLRQGGADVVVLDKATFPRHKVCGGWITPPVLEELRIDVADFGRQNIIQPITRFITGFIEGRELETVYGRAVSYGIRRNEFDHYLLARSNARLRLGEPLQALTRSADGWLINDSLRANIVISAGGHFCPVTRLAAKSLGETQAHGANTTADDLPTVVAQEVEFEMTPEQQTQCSVLRDRPELFFCPDLKGYGWIFRKHNYLNVGLGREGESQLSHHVARFVDWLIALRKVPPDLPRRFHGHAYHLRTRLRETPTSAPGLLVIGDALGLAERQSGEGIRPAIESGLLAAACILECRDQPSRNLQTIYQERLHRRFAAATKAPLGSLLPGGVSRLAAQWLMGSRMFVRHVVLDRGFLHIQQPALTV